MLKNSSIAYAYQVDKIVVGIVEDQIPRGFFSNTFKILV